MNKKIMQVVKPACKTVVGTTMIVTGATLIKTSKFKRKNELGYINIGVGAGVLACTAAPIVKNLLKKKADKTVEISEAANED